MIYLVVSLLILIIILLAIYICFIKFTLKSIIQQLQEDNFARKVNVTLIDQNLIHLVKTINQGIMHYQSQILEVRRKEQLLKSSILNISHDLRTPLTSMIGYIQLLNTSNLTQQQSHNLEIALSRSKELKLLISNFYELSIIENKDDEPIFEQIDVMKILPEYLLEFASELEDKNIIPQIISKNSKVVICADHFMMKRIINNVISNAVKYGSHFLNIYIETGFEENIIKITFENGILDDRFEVSRVFEKFYTGESYGNGGTGLGLYITKEFVHKMNGKITAYMGNMTFNIQLEFINVI